MTSTPPDRPSSSPDLRASITSGIAPTPQTTASAGERPAGLRHDALDALVVALETIDLVVADHVDAVGLRGRLKVAARPAAEVALERDGLLHDDRAPLAERGQRGGDLAADV